MNLPRLLFRKVPRTFFLLFCLLTSAGSYSQKNAPVAGDASELVKLLKKDYSLIDASIRNEEILKDRAFVILTFRSYLIETQVEPEAFKVAVVSYEKALTDFKRDQLILTTYSNKIDKADKLEPDKLEGLIKKTDSTKKKYYTNRYKADLAVLKLLEVTYAKENCYAAHVLGLFVNKYETIEKNKYDKLAKSNPNASIQKAVPFIGGDMGFDVVIEGLSKFLAKRIKEELTTYVIERVKEALKNPGPNDPLAELKVLLPRTNTYLLNFNASQVTSFPDEIKQYIEDDFNHILENIGGLRNTPRIKQLVNKYPEADLTLEALELIPTLSKIKNPVDYFEILENSRFVNRWSESKDNDILFNIGNTLKMSSMLAHSLTMVENGETRFVGTDFFNTYGSDLHFYLLYTGFLYQQNVKYYDVQFAVKTNERISIKKGEEEKKSVNGFRIPLKAVMDTLIYKFDITKLDSLKKEITFFSRTFESLGQHAEKVYLTGMEIKKANKAGKNIGADTIQTFISSLIDFSEELVISNDALVNYLIAKLGKFDSIVSNNGDFKFIPIKGREPDKYIERINLTGKSAPYFKIARKINEIVYDLQKKDYAVAIIKSLEITSELMPEQSADAIKLLDTILKQLPNKDTLSNWDLEDWRRIVTYIKTDTIWNPGKKTRNSAKVVYNKLLELKTYYEIYPEQGDEKLIKDISEFMDVLNSISKGVNPGDPVKKLIESLKDVSYKNIVLSLYLKLPVEQLENQIMEKLSDVHIQVKGKSVPLFDSTDIKDLKSGFEKYRNALFSYMTQEMKGRKVKTDRNKRNEDLHTANEDFKRLLTKLILRAPEKFDLHLNDNTLKLIHFVNDMAVSENSDDVADAIEAFALPAGSYAIKRTVMRNISINAYPGLMAAGDITWKNKAAYVGFSPSFTAPVGINLSFSDKRGFSHSIFMPIIDIGAFTRMYLTKNPVEKDSTTVSTLPDFKFQTIFSPGLYYSLGIKKTPLSLNIGLQYGPGLKAILANGETKVYESLRFGIGLVLDIPLLNLHTRLKPLER